MAPVGDVGGGKRALTWQVPLKWLVFVWWFRMFLARSVEAISKNWTECVETLIWFKKIVRRNLSFSFSCGFLVR